ncbi:hypothetical protein [Nitrospirillum pindoramense]|uniref:Uncharacterized protein n=1 Tax=Nitrospirillum amazonense TaxID=28077 RepID=A0A560GMK6_9PROT|nr:hypothetical protein [Nitrospirillum amazonense]TWB35228.1 hypothetical protein FBZ90_12027 [Nitrospirillum amazonense]
MTVSSISHSPLSPTQSNASGPVGGSAAPSAGFSSLLGGGNTETDSINVNLPNGFSVGLSHVGGGFSGFSAQMLSSLENMVKTFSNVDTQNGAQPSGKAPGHPGSGDGSGTQQFRTLDTFHVDLPDGTSVTIHHGGPDGENNPAAMDAMVQAMQSLMSDFADVATQTKGINRSLLNHG